MNATMIARGLDRTFAMLAGVALYMILVGNGCMRPMLPGDRLEEGAAIETLSDRTPPVYSQQRSRRQ